ncbi:hypothetical protein KTE13_27385 [Burkholderia multivorans]|uniref:hypothetical protein n=1 Tax=Burkholderia multivorans TaxID=87883 RepID=UPI001C22B2DA|nr:hypothetical protein [Burkholderia multivorans]MBU9403472.1 hypothetical protein [Burkholderia multivorans]MDN8050534.1 hypothetical protein [Burkholderia multivorans]
MTNATVLVKIATSMIAKDRAHEAPVDLSRTGRERDRSEADSKALREFVRLTKNTPLPATSSVPSQLFNVR